MKSEPEPVNGAATMARMDALVGKVLSVSREELARREAVYKRHIAEKPAKAGPGAMYREVLAEVKRANGFTAKTCWIADVKAELGMSTRRAPNRINEAKRKCPCPPDKRQPIIDAMRRLNLIEA